MWLSISSAAPWRHIKRGYMEERGHGSRLKPPGSAGNMPTELLNWIIDCIVCETGHLGPQRCFGRHWSWQNGTRESGGRPCERERGILTGSRAAVPGQSACMQPSQQLERGNSPRFLSPHL